MKSVPSGMLMALAGAATLTGCASAPPLAVGAVGPDGAIVSGLPTGTLVVYGATTVYTAEQSRYAQHTSYTLFDDKGTQLQKVNNHAGLFAADPATLTLAAGRYRIKALTVFAGSVMVPVVIEPGRSTTVYLDGTPVPQDLQAGNDVVKLPNGQVIGWRAR